MSLWFQLQFSPEKEKKLRNRYRSYFYPWPDARWLFHDHRKAELKLNLRIFRDMPKSRRGKK